MLYASLGLMFLAVTGFSFYVSSVVRRGALEPTRSVPPFNLEVVDISDRRITLRPLQGTTAGGRWKRAGIWGLRGTNGHGRVEGIVDSGDNSVVRQWTRFDGTIAPGDAVRLDSAAFPLDPRAAFNLRFRPVEYESSAGRFRGWVTDGNRSTWVLFLHGKRAARPGKPPYSYPILPLATTFGFPCFDLTYRNDVDAPRGDGHHWYGLKEWEDLEAAARYALDHGARKLILVGYSMGGAIALSFLYRSRLADTVAGLILDAPVLDLRAVIDFGIHKRGIPHVLIRPGLWLTEVRFGFKWRSFDYLKDVGRLTAPILLFHGNRDSTVPIRCSERLAALRPDIVTYVRMPDAEHADSWNVDRPGYETSVRDFLSALAT